jgi:anti-sigma28 factor (negative regulator of flagellin synthesis)
MDTGQPFRNSMTNSLERTMDLPEVRMERIIKIRTAIANGCYNVSSAELAQKLIGNMLGNFH